RARRPGLACPPLRERRSAVAKHSGVKKVRERTGLPLLVCRDALARCGGDVEQALALIVREMNAVTLRPDVETGAGRIGAYVDPEEVGALVELRCESPAVARTELFVRLADDLARQAALADPEGPEEMLAQPFLDDASRTVQARVAEVVARVGEQVRPARLARLTGR